MASHAVLRSLSRNVMRAAWYAASTASSSSFVSSQRARQRLMIWMWQPNTHTRKAAKNIDVNVTPIMNPLNGVMPRPFLPTALA